MNGMTWFVRFCALYNFSGALAFLIPGALELVGVQPPASSFWLWLPALMGTFAGLVLLYAASDLKRNATLLPYWNGLVRLVFVVLTFALDFGGSVGRFVALLALGDLPLALGAILGLPKVLARRHADLLLNRA